MTEVLISSPFAYRFSFPPLSARWCFHPGKVPPLFYTSVLWLRAFSDFLEAWQRGARVRSSTEGRTPDSVLNVWSLAPDQTSQGPKEGGGGCRGNHNLEITRNPKG